MMYEHDDTERVETVEDYESPQIKVLELDQVIRGIVGSNIDGLGGNIPS